MKTKAIALFLLGFIPAFAQDIPTSKTEQNMDRIERCKKNYTELFGGEALTGQGTDPEMMDILQKFIFGEVFRTGDLDKNRKNVKENQKLIIENCKKYNHPFIMGSDAHFTTDIANYDHCGPLVESMNVDNELIMNYYPDRLREFLRK